MFSKDDTSIESNKKIIARAKQMYRKEMPLYVMSVKKTLNSFKNFNSKNLGHKKEGKRGRGEEGRRGW